MMAPDPSDPANQTIVTVSPGYNMSLLSNVRNARLSLPNRLNFGQDPVPGISGYQYWTGLKQRVQRVVDGYEPDSDTFPGVKAAGVAIEVREPQIQNVVLSALIKPSLGLSLASISDSIKSSVVGFINSLGLGQDVILSEIVLLMQSVDGVDSVVLVNPALDQERIVVADNAIPRANASSITLS
jgi:hypothetical protein